MKKQTYLIALGLLILPILVRALWFYHGFSVRPEIATPDYASFAAPQPPLETPQVDESKIKQFGGTVILDGTHLNQFQPDEIQSLKDAVEKRGGTMELLTDSTLLENSLKYASAYVVLAPSSFFLNSEISILESFVVRGGRLVVFTDATRGLITTDYFSGTTTVYPDANAVNPLLEPFGITILNDYLYNLAENEGNFRNVFFDEFGKAELTFGLKQVAFYGTHSVESRSGLILFQGTESTFSSIDDAHDPAQGGAAISEDGNVVAFGDFTFLTSPYNNVADNSTLIDNIADFLLGGKGQPTFANFPYIFNQQTLQVYPTSDVQMTAEMISALSTLQVSLQAANTSMQIVQDKPTEGDTLVIGTFSVTEDLDPYINKFNLVFDEAGEFITVPGFGNIGRSGNGILLLEHGKNGNTLILLADTIDDLPTMLGILSSGSLSACIVQDTSAVCSIGFGGDFSVDGSLDGELTEEAGTDEVITPEPVATAAG